MLRRPPRSTRTDTLFPYTTLFRSSPLLGLDNVILTPHVGGSTLEAQDNIGVEVAAKLVRYSDNGSTLSAVNFPEVTLPGHAGSRRLLHIHRNVPGVLSQVNEVFGRHSVNRSEEHTSELQSLMRISYAVFCLKTNTITKF